MKAKGKFLTGFAGGLALAVVIGAAIIFPAVPPFEVGPVRRVFCPVIYADVTFPGSTGFSAILKPDSRTTEFVMGPNTVAHLSVMYYSSDNDLTSAIPGPIVGSTPTPVWAYNEPTGGASGAVGISLSLTNRTYVDTHTVVENYTLQSGQVMGTFIIGLQSTCLTTIVQVGYQAFVGILPDGWKAS